VLLDEKPKAAGSSATFQPAYVKYLERYVAIKPFARSAVDTPLPPHIFYNNAIVASVGPDHEREAFYGCILW